MKEPPCFAGIAVGRDWLDLALRPHRQHERFANDEDGITRLVARASAPCIPSSLFWKPPEGWKDRSPRPWPLQGSPSPSSTHARYGVSPRRSGSSPRPTPSMPTC